MATTPIDNNAWRDKDASADDGEGVLVMRLLVRLRALEARVADDESAIATIQNRLSLINAVLHLW